MPPRLRLPAALLALVALTALAAVVLWRDGTTAAAEESRAHARSAAAALEQRVAATTLAIQGVRSAHESGPVDRAAFLRLARLPLARAEVVALGWAPRVPAAQRSALETAEQIRILAPADAAATYPLLLREPPLGSADVPDLNSDPTLGEALRRARTDGEPRLSAPVRLPGDGRIGTYVFVPVYAPDVPARTPGERREALRGVVVGALASETLVAEATAGAPVRVTEGPAVLGGEPLEPGAVASAAVGDRTWTVAVAPVEPSRVAPLAALLAGLALTALLAIFHRRLARLTDAARRLQSTLAGEQRRAKQKLRAAEERVGETERAVALVADAADAVVLDVDGDGVITSCSAAARRVLGWAPDELVGSTVFELLHPDELLAPSGDRRRYRRADGAFVVLETSRIARHDALGFTRDVVYVLREPARESLLRSAAQRIGDAVALEPDPLELFEVVAEEAAAELDVPAVALVRFEAGGFGTVVGVSADDPSRLPPTGATVALDGETPAGRVFGEGAATDGAAPLRVGTRLWGALVAEGADLAALVELADLVQGAVGYADATARLRALATRDPLTNLPDERSFREQLRAEVRRAQRHGRALALALLELDGPVADSDLVDAARRLAGAVRGGELVARPGPATFAWLLPETGGLNGWVAAERARTALGNTVSAGGADLEGTTTADELLAAARVALDGARAAGGDTTFRYSSELAV